VPAVPSSCVDAAAAGVPAVGRPCRRDPAASQWARHFSSGEMTLPFRFSSQSFVSTLVLLLVVGLWQWPKGCTAARKAGLRCVDAAGRRCVLSFDHAVADWRTLRPQRNKDEAAVCLWPPTENSQAEYDFAKKSSSKACWLLPMLIIGLLHSDPWSLAADDFACWLSAGSAQVGWSAVYHCRVPRCRRFPYRGQLASEAWTDNCWPTTSSKSNRCSKRKFLGAIHLPLHLASKMK